MNGIRKCSSCGAELAADVAGEHCAKCQALSSSTVPEPTARAEETIVLSFPPEAGGQNPGDRIGRYKLLENIGEGGMGSVWVADQTEPVRRQVALKVIKLGMDTRQVVARFEAERQALALMDHPNIAKVLDGGATETGRPFFVMELVKGVRITDYCDQHRLSTAARLDLFIQVCKAIQHAHQKGIIHRDIKPSNVLVSLNDGLPAPKVIDFGIAKATAGQTLTDKTVFTAIEQFIGTPAYTSPEQAEMTSLDIDTRSDIYSLGVLLYELLTGKTPFEAHELLQAGLDGMRRIIREKEPSRPSTRLSTLNADEQTTVAKQRQSDLPKLLHLIRGDLDWIVMKCLEKDRTRRYETANALARDIQRHLNCEPVEARPPSELYRFKQLVRRNKLTFASVVAIAILLISGIASSLWQAHKAKLAEANARTEATKSQAVAGFLGNMLASVSPSVAKGRDTALLREVLDQTAETLDVELRDQPEVEAELCDTIGRVYHALGFYPRSADMHRQALDTWRRLPGKHDAKTAASLCNLASALDSQSRLREAEILYREALTMQTNLFGPSHRDIATTLNSLANLLREEHKLTESEALYSRAFEIRKKLFGAESLEIAASLNGWAAVLRDGGRLSEAERMYRQALDIRRQSASEASVAAACNDLANVLRDQAKFSEAESDYRKALGIYQRILDKEHPVLAIALNNVAIVLRDQGKLSEAENIFRQVLAMQEKRLGPNHREVAQSLSNLAAVLHEEVRLVEAEANYRRALAIRQQLPDQADTAKVMNDLAGVLQNEGRVAQAVELYRACLAIREKELPNSWETFNARSELGGALLIQKQYSEVEALLLSGYRGMNERRQSIPALSRTHLVEALQRLVEFYRATGHPDLAAKWQEELRSVSQANPNFSKP